MGTGATVWSSPNVAYKSRNWADGVYDDGERLYPAVSRNNYGVEKACQTLVTLVIISRDDSPISADMSHRPMNIADTFNNDITGYALEYYRGAELIFGEDGYSTTFATGRGSHTYGSFSTLEKLKKFIDHELDIRGMKFPWFSTEL